MVAAAGGLGRSGRAAYAAAVCGGLYAAVSLYWALGGRLGLQTLGGYAGKLARSGGAQGGLVIWAAVLAKTACVLLALSLAQPWGRAVPRRWRAVAAVLSSLVLVLYGGIWVTGEALVELGMIRGRGPVDWASLRWYLALWDPWFLLWGVLLSIATWQFLHGPALGQAPAVK